MKRLAKSIVHQVQCTTKIYPRGVYFLLLYAGNGTKSRFKSSVLSRSHPLESRSEMGIALRDDSANGFKLE